jgi:hypothetical protein
MKFYSFAKRQATIKVNQCGKVDNGIYNKSYYAESLFLRLVFHVKAFVTISRASLRIC